MDTTCVRIRRGIYDDSITTGLSIILINYHFNLAGFYGDRNRNVS